MKAMHTRRLVVGLVAEFPPPAAGMTVQADTLRRRLLADGYGVISVATNPQLPVPLRFLGRVRFVRGAIAWTRFLAALWRLSRVDVVHLFAASWLNYFLFVAPTVAVARVLGRPVVMHYHGGAAAEFLARREFFALPVLRAVQRVVVPSAFLQEVFGRYGVEAAVIANPVDVERRAELPDPERFVVLSCRNLAPVYDIETAIRAFAELREAEPNATLRVAGDGPDRGALERLVTDLGLTEVVDFLGNVAHTDMAEVRRGCHTLVNSSTVDNQPVSLIEAMASGLPIVSTDAGGIPDLVEHGETALLASVGDSVALGEHLRTVASDPAVYRSLRERGLQRATRFSWEHVGEAWRGLYDEVVPVGARHAAGAATTTRQGAAQP